MKTPNKYFIVSGSAEGSMPLNAFDHALINSGVGDLNLLRVSSILPPNCEFIKPIKLENGSLVTIAYASIKNQTPGINICSGVACGIPKDRTKPGLIMEHSDICNKDNMKNTLTNMVEEGMRYRNVIIEEIKFGISEHKVIKTAAVFAGVVLCYL